MYLLKIYDSSGNLKAHVKNLVPLDKTGAVLRFTDYLSSYGYLKFRVQTKDPLVSTGIFAPYQYHVNLYKDNAVVWAGVIINHPHRTHEYMEIEARTYAFLLTKVQVEHSTTMPDYREFNSGTMSAAVTALFNEGKNRTSSPASSFTLGTVTNPNYPWDPSTAWTFTSIYTMRFEYANLFNVINSFADITDADWEVTKDKVFNFKPTIGSDRTDISFMFGRGGNVENYDSPLDGSNLVNDYIVACLLKNSGTIIRSAGSDTSTFGTYGRLWRGETLNEELVQQLLDEKRKKIFDLNKTPDSEIHLVLNEKAPAVGTFSLGDKVKVIINDGSISINKTIRIIGYQVDVYNAGRALTTVITNNKQA